MNNVRWTLYRRHSEGWILQQRDEVDRTREPSPLGVFDDGRVLLSVNPTWPHVHARLDCSFEEFLSVFPCNHVLGISGDRVQALTTLCEITGITPILLGSRGQDRIPPIWERM